MSIQNIVDVIGERCIFTNLEYRTSLQDSRDCIEYAPIFPNENYIKNTLQENIVFSISPDVVNSGILNKHKTIIAGIILNDNWSFPNSELITIEKLTHIIESSFLPSTPLEKIEFIFTFLFSNTITPSQKIVIHKFHDEYGSDWPNKFFCKSKEEFAFYMDYLYTQGYIDGVCNRDNDYDVWFNAYVTLDGYHFAENLQERKEDSKNCFVAMSFSNISQISNIRRTIKKVVKSCGYKPILIDETHPDPEQTINDAIIAELKKAKFCVADFTEQKDGVYFESGYALGLGLKVIYTCSQVDFNESHFDTNHFPHIVYESLDQLESALKDKINAWID